MCDSWSENLVTCLGLISIQSKVKRPYRARRLFLANMCYLWKLFSDKEQLNCKKMCSQSQARIRFCDHVSTGFVTQLAPTYDCHSYAQYEMSTEIWTSPRDLWTVCPYDYLLQMGKVPISYIGRLCKWVYWPYNAYMPDKRLRVACDLDERNNKGMNRADHHEIISNLNQRSQTIYCCFIQNMWSLSTVTPTLRVSLYSVMVTNMAKVDTCVNPKKNQ